MRLAILSYGTRGDVQPYVVAARALRGRGHDVWVAGSEDSRGFVESAGVSYRPLAGHARALLDSEAGRRLLASGSVVETARRMVAYTRARRDALDASLEAACEGATTILGSMLLAERVASISERTGQGLLMSTTIPLMPTRELVSPLIDVDLGPGALARLTHVLAHRVFYWMNRADTNHLRARLGLGPLRRPVWSSFQRSGVPILSLNTTGLVPLPRDWDERWLMTGVPRPDAELRAALGELALPPEIEAFLAEGPPPVFIGFGSMPVLDPVATLALTERALARTGQRALIGAGWSSVPSGVRSSRLAIVGSVDHERVLPRCAAMIHHGGAGTTFTALAAGLPAAVLSVFGDQPFWGRRLARLGVGLHRRFRALSEALLVDVLTRLSQPELHDRARQLGARLREERGTEQLVEAIEAWAPRAGPAEL